MPFSLRPVLVLTNGTAPFIRRAHQLAQLKGRITRAELPRQHRLSG